MPLYPRSRGLLVAMGIPTGIQQPGDGYCSSQKYPKHLVLSQTPHLVPWWWIHYQQYHYYLEVESVQ